MTKAVKTPPRTGQTRQKTVAGSAVASAAAAATAKTPPPARRKKSWPIIEIVLVLLVIKIAAGGWYFFSGNWRVKAEFTPPSAAGALADGASRAVSPTPEPAATPSVPARAAAAVDSYLAAAATSALSAGARMVVAGQAASPPMAQGAIPLPPGDTDLLTPAAELPPPQLPTLGQNRDVAPLPPSGAPAPSDVNAIRDLREREQSLARREAAISTREEALNALDSDLRGRMQANEASRQEMEMMVRRNEAILAEMKALQERQREEEELLRDARIQHLVTAYKGMKADQAGNLVNALDDDVAVAILSAMPGRNAGLILAFVDPEKAARLTKAISERRIDPNLLLAENPPAPGETAAP